MLENFRPGTLERWGLGPDELAAANPRLVLARVSGFGQTGPYAGAPGFGTLAEAMSGFAALNGEPDGPPLLPPFALADGVAALATAFAILVALRAREQTGRGQVVDTSLIEPLMTLLGPQLTAYDLLGELQERTGNRSSHNAPRNVYRTADDRWVAVSASAGSIAERVMRLVGRPDLAEQPWFATGSGRAAHAARSTRPSPPGSPSARATRCSPRSSRPRPRSPRSTTRPTSLADPQLAALGSIATVDDPLGPIKMPNVISRLSETPGEIRHAGRAHGADTEAVLAELGVDARRARAAPRGGRRCERPAAHVALRPGRPARPRREGDRLGRARGDRRPRGRRRARREGGGAREPRGPARPRAREAGLRPHQLAAHEPRGGRPGGDRRRSRA